MAVRRREDVFMSVSEVAFSNLTCLNADASKIFRIVIFCGLFRWEGYGGV